MIAGLALILGVLVAMIVPFALGENPLQVMHTLFVTSIDSQTQLGYSLFYSTPLIFTGLSVAWALRTGLFNIGAEGQMTIGGLAMVAAGILAPDLPPVPACLLAMTAAFFAAGLWGAIAGWMRAYRGVHEVLTTILLNFVSYGVTAFFILHVFKDQTSASPETLKIGAGYILSAIPWLGGSSPLSVALLFGFAAAAVYALVFARTKFGFRQKLTGGAFETARRAGIQTRWQVTSAMFISGGLAGLAAMAPVMGSMNKLREGFSGGAGFVGIAVALLGRGRALGIVLSAIFFGILTTGSLNLDIDSEKITRDLAFVIQAIIILCVASPKGISDAAAWLKKKVA